MSSMDEVDLMAVLIDHGMVLESAKGPLPNLAELIAGEPIRGSWWGHPAGHEIFERLNELADSPDVVRTRLVNKRVTLIHRRVWAALVVVADQLPVERLAAKVRLTSCWLKSGDRARTSRGAGLVKACCTRPRP